MRWSIFLKAHLRALAAMDFFTIGVIAWPGLVRCLALFVIDLKTRQVEIAGIIAARGGAWMCQVARNMTDCETGFLRESHYPIHDRDPLFTKHSRVILGTVGLRCVRLPSRSPNRNAFAERFVRSIKSECLGQIIPIGESHLRRVVSEHADHHHDEQKQQGLGNRMIRPKASFLRSSDSVGCRERLGGLLRYYRQAA